MRWQYPTTWNGRQYPSQNEAARQNGYALSTMRSYVMRGFESDADVRAYRAWLRYQFATHSWKPCTVNGVQYPSIKSAAQALGYSPWWVGEMVRRDGDKARLEPRTEKWERKPGGGHWWQRLR